MYNMNSQARDDLSLWLQCIRPYGGSSQLIDSIRRAYRYTPKHIVVITDGMTDMKPANLHSELLNANDKISNLCTWRYNFTLLNGPMISIFFHIGPLSDPCKEKI